jgi:hypothetical protein
MVRALHRAPEGQIDAIVVEAGETVIEIVLLLIPTNVVDLVVKMEKGERVKIALGEVISSLTMLGNISREERVQFVDSKSSIYRHMLVISFCVSHQRWEKEE